MSSEASNRQKGAKVDSNLINPNNIVDKKLKNITSTSTYAKVPTDSTTVAISGNHKEKEIQTICSQLNCNEPLNITLDENFTYIKFNTEEELQNFVEQLNQEYKKKGKHLLKTISSEQILHSREHVSESSQSITPSIEEESEDNDYEKKNDSASSKIEKSSNIKSSNNEIHSSSSLLLLNQTLANMDNRKPVFDVQNIDDIWNATKNDDEQMWPTKVEKKSEQKENIMIQQINQQQQQINQLNSQLNQQQQINTQLNHQISNQLGPQINQNNKERLLKCNSVSIDASLYRYMMDREYMNNTYFQNNTGLNNSTQNNSSSNSNMGNIMNGETAKLLNAYIRDNGINTTQLSNANRARTIGGVVSCERDTGYPFSNSQHMLYNDSNLVVTQSNSDTIDRRLNQNWNTKSDMYYNNTNNYNNIKSSISCSQPIHYTGSISQMDERIGATTSCEQSHDLSNYYTTQNIYNPKLDLYKDEQVNSTTVRKYTCKYDIPIGNCKEFGIARRIIGAKGQNMKKIVTTTGSKLRLRGIGSGYLEGTEKKESNEPLHICISCTDMSGYQLACTLVENLMNDIIREYLSWLRTRGSIPTNFDPANLIPKKREHFIYGKEGADTCARSSVGERTPSRKASSVNMTPVRSLLNNTSNNPFNINANNANTIYNQNHNNRYDFMHNIYNDKNIFNNTNPNFDFFDDQKNGFDDSNVQELEQAIYKQRLQYALNNIQQQTQNQSNTQNGLQCNQPNLQQTIQNEYMCSQMGYPQYGDGAAPPLHQKMNFMEYEEMKKNEERKKFTQPLINQNLNQFNKKNAQWINSMVIQASYGANNRMNNREYTDTTDTESKKQKDDKNFMNYLPFYEQKNEKLQPMYYDSEKFEKFQNSNNSSESQQHALLLAQQQMYLSQLCSPSPQLPPGLQYNNNANNSVNNSANITANSPSLLFLNPWTNINMDTENPEYYIKKKKNELKKNYEFPNSLGSFAFSANGLHSPIIPTQPHAQIFPNPQSLAALAQLKQSQPIQNFFISPWSPLLPNSSQPNGFSVRMDNASNIDENQ